CTLRGTRVRGAASGHLCPDLGRILGGVPASLVGDRRNRYWRAARPCDGGTPTAPSRLWREHRASDAKSHDTTLRLLARIGRAAFRFYLHRRQHSELNTLRAGTDTSSNLQSVHIPRVVSP